MKRSLAFLLLSGVAPPCLGGTGVSCESQTYSDLRAMVENSASHGEVVQFLVSAGLSFDDVLVERFPDYGELPPVNQAAAGVIIVASAPKQIGASRDGVKITAVNLVRVEYDASRKSIGIGCKQVLTGP